LFSKFRPLTLRIKLNSPVKQHYSTSVFYFLKTFTEKQNKLCATQAGRGPHQTKLDVLFNKKLFFKSHCLKIFAPDSSNKAKSFSKTVFLICCLSFLKHAPEKLSPRTKMSLFSRLNLPRRMATDPPRRSCPTSYVFILSFSLHIISTSA
jgi:hypothetical protein